MSVTAIYHPSIALIVHDIIVALSETVGKFSSAFGIYYLHTLLPLLSRVYFLGMQFCFIHMSCLLSFLAIMCHVGVVDSVLLIMHDCPCCQIFNAFLQAHLS